MGESAVAAVFLAAELEAALPVAAAPVLEEEEPAKGKFIPRCRSNGDSMMEAIE